VAGKLILLRKELDRPDYDLRRLARQIQALGLLPDSEGLPPVYYMALRSVYWRLTKPTYEDDIEIAKDLLWDVAIKLEGGDISVIENSLITKLDDLRLVLNQKKPIADVRDEIRSADRLFRQYSNAMENNFSNLYSLKIDFKSLRKLYSYILSFSEQEKYYNAALVVDFIRKGIVQNDDLILSKEGLGNYFVLSESRQIIENLISIQKTLLASSYNEQMKVKSKNIVDNQDMNENRIILQSKVGDAVKLLGEKISFTGTSSEFLIHNASQLIQEILTNMKTSEISQVTQSQSELIGVMSNLKRLLNKPVSQSKELRDILHEINSKPVS